MYYQVRAAPMLAVRDHFCAISQEGKPIGILSFSLRIDDWFSLGTHDHLPPCLGPLHSKAVVERGLRTRSLHPFFSKGAIEHCKLTELLLLEEVLRLILLIKNKKEQL
jgi:hypothetical protein